MNLIDTHCHLIDDKFTDIKAVLDRARRAGIAKIIVPTGNLDEARKAVLLAEKEKLFCMAGIHPEEVGRVVGIENMMGELKRILESSERVVGVGEIGLDFYRDKEKKTKEMQLELFRKQMNLASNIGLPAVIHMREAEKEMTDELKKLSKLPSGQFHCFAGSEDFLGLVLELGFYVSFCGNITYKSAGGLRSLLHKVPLDRLLLETDSPYLSPEPLRGTVNEPANVKIVAEFIARELNIELSKLAEITGKNTLCLYSLDI